MSIYRFSAGSNEEFCYFLNSCIKYGVEFKKFTIIGGADSTEPFTGEFEITFPKYEMEDLIEDLNKEKGANISLGKRIYRNIDTEIRRIKSIYSMKSKQGDSLDEVETKLVKFQKGFMAFVKAHRKLEDYRSQMFFHKNIKDLDWATYFLAIIRNAPDMEKVSDNLIIIFEQIMKAYEKYKFDLTNWDDTKKDSELVEEAIEKEFDKELYEFKTAYFDLSKEFFEKLDVFIGEDTVFRFSEKATS